MVLSFDLKDSSGICIISNSTGSEFHNVGPETATLRRPMQTVRVGGTARFPCAADHRRWEPLPTGEIISARYEGASHHVDTCRQEDQGM